MGCKSLGPQLTSLTLVLIHASAASHICNIAFLVLAVQETKCSNKVIGWQVKRVGSVALLHSGGTTSGIQCPVLEPSSKEGPVGAGPQEGHKYYQRNGTLPLQRKAKGVGILCPGEGSSETLLEPFST